MGAFLVSGLKGTRGARTTRLVTALIGALALAVAAGSWTRVLAALGAFDPGIEGEIWQQLDPIGQGLGMNAPLYVAVDNSNGNTYVTDHWNNRVLVFDFAGNSIPLANPIGATPGGSPLLFPEGIEVDASHQIIVGDSFDGRVAVFGSDGNLNFDVRIVDALPTGVAVTPGASVTGNQVVPLNPLIPNPNRVVVSDKYHCFVYIYDTDFHPITRLGSGICDVTDGDFDVPEGVAIDAAGHIFVTDYGNSRINIYDSNGNYLGKFGQPPAAGPGALQSPTDVLVSSGRGHVGRVVVMDSANQRLAFYDVSFTTTPPAATATYQFSITAQGGLSFPTGIAEDTSHDPVGRLVVTDTGQNRIQRFQVPELAIVQVTINPLATPPSGSFGVVVPVGKDPAGVLGVIPTVVGTHAAVNFPQPPPVDIFPGQIATYTFQYSPGAPPVSFAISAKGNCVTPTSCNTTSNEAVVTPAVPCAGCSSSAVVISPSGAQRAAARRTGWYAAPVTVRITATTPLIKYIFSGPEGGAQPGLHTAAAASVDVVFSQEKSSAIEYWAVDSDFTEELPHHVLPIALDLTPPIVTFQFRNASPQPNAAGWWNAASVRVPFTISDDVSSVTLAPGSPVSPLVFTAEGADLVQTVSVVDAAGNRSDVPSRDESGHGVNIDRMPPTLTVPAPLTLVRPADAATAALAQGQFQATATDAVSGVQSITNPTPGTVFPPGTTTWTFVATDVAGNQTTGTSTITVVDSLPPTISVALNPGVLWPPNHKMVTITASVTASAPVTLVSITSSEPDNGLGDGDTPNDIQGAAYGTDDRVFQLRAERSGKGPGRTYTITYRATGPTGAVTTATAKVTVPHDQRK